jgi:hypothetical protein
LIRFGDLTPILTPGKLEEFFIKNAIPTSPEWRLRIGVPADYSGAVPDGFELIDLVPCKLMIFQGEPYKDEEFDKAVLGCIEKIDIFNPKVYGYDFAPELAPRMQLNPEGWRGYIELRPVREARCSMPY